MGPSTKQPYDESGHSQPLTSDSDGSQASHDPSHPNDTNPNKQTSKPKGFSASSSSTVKKGAGGGFSASSTVEKPSSSGLGSGLFSDGEPSAKKKGFKKLFTKKRAAAGGGIIGVSLTASVMLSGIVSGPLQFVHFAQLLQGFHFSAQEDFGGDRTGKFIFYALSGDAENGRLGFVGNAAANSYERDLARKGIRPVYDSKTGRLVGFATDDKNIADAIKNDSGSKNKIKTIGEGENIKGSKRSPELNKSNYFVELRGDCNFKCRKGAIKNVMKSTKTFKTSAMIGSRLLILRGGVDYHPLNEVKKGVEESNIAFIKRILRGDAKNTKEGTQVSNADRETRNSEGETGTEPDTDTQQRAEEGETEALEQAGTGDATNDIYKKALLRGGGAAVAVIGALCTAQDLGDSVEDYKYTNSVLPMLRMGMKTVTMGNQVMSGDDLSPDSLKPYNTRLYDEKAPKGSRSWKDAKSVQAELGQRQTGPDTPKEAQLKNVNDQPAFFDAINGIPGLGDVCSVGDAVSNLPIIKQVSEAVSATFIAGANKFVLNNFGTSVEDLGARALAVVAGDSVNVFAKGAEYGNLANTGSFLASNDAARTSGGSPLSNTDVAILKAEQFEKTKKENSSRSIAGRYLDPYNSSSLVASTLLSGQPQAFFSTMVSDPSSLFKNLGTSLYGAFSPSVKAATTGYDYGVPKYGFSAAERDNPEFDDPFKNAKLVEDSGKLDDLNEKYGSTCFGMKVIIGNQDARVESEQEGGPNLNFLKTQKDHPECDPKNNTDPWFLRYRFYLADALNINSMACFYGDDTACTSLGFSSGSSSSSGSITPDTEFNLDELYESSENISCAAGTNDIGVQDGYHENQKIKVRVCGLPNVPETGDVSPLPGADGKLLVNSRMSAFYVQLIKDAQNDGVAGISAAEGFRTMARQTELKAQYGSAAAEPGTSNHQMGLAVDWGDSMITYLNGNSHGLKALLVAEPWHWSPTGN